MKRYIAFKSVNARLGKAICIGFTVTYTNAGSATSVVTTWIRILLILRTLPLALAHERTRERERGEKHTLSKVFLFELFSTRGIGAKISILFPRFFSPHTPLSLSSRLSYIRNEIFARRHARVADFYLVSYFYLFVFRLFSRISSRIPVLFAKIQ